MLPGAHARPARNLLPARRRKMVEIVTREATSCDLKELVGKFIPEVRRGRWPLPQRPALAVDELWGRLGSVALGAGVGCWAEPPPRQGPRTSRPCFMINRQDWH